MIFPERWNYAATCPWYVELTASLIRVFVIAPIIVLNWTIRLLLKIIEVTAQLAKGTVKGVWAFLMFVVASLLVLKAMSWVFAGIG